MSNSLNELRHALTTPVGSHLDDEMLAEIAAAESAGEDIDALYPEDMAHLSQCPDCVSIYSELASLWQTAVTDMSVTAQSLTPQQAFLALLQKDSAVSVNTAALEAAAFPLLFPQAPDTPEAFDAALENATIPAQSEGVVQAARRNLAALAAFLSGGAAAVWGQSLEVKTAVSTHGYQLQFEPAPPIAIPVLSSGEGGSEWHLLARRIGQPAWHLSVRARRETATTCTLLVQADRPGLTNASGRAITIEYGTETKTAVTNSNGEATFPHIPIFALPALQMIINTET
jgi:hypothetical protein